MNGNTCFLITVLSKHDETLLECALKVNRDDLPGDCGEYPMEPENRRVLWDLLPMNVRSVGPIVNVTEIFEIYCG